MIAAPRERVWELVSDPHHLPRWWPRAVRVEDVRRCGSGTRSAVDDGARDRARQGRAGRLPLHQRGARGALRLGAGARGHALRADPALLARSRSGSRARTAGTEVTLASSERLRGLSRLGSPMMRRRPGSASTRRWTGSSGRWANRESGVPAQTRPRRKRSSGSRRRPVVRRSRTRGRPYEVVGLGRPASGAGARRRGAMAALRSELGEAEPAQRVSRSRRSRCPRRVRCRRRSPRRSGAAAVLDGHEHRVRRAAGRGYPDLVRLRAGRLEEAPDAVVLPGSADEVARVLEICAREGIARGPVRRRHERRRRRRAAAGRLRAARSRLDLGGCAASSVDHRSLTATLGPGPARTRGRGGACGAGRHAGPLPAVVRVRDDRRLRGDPLGRAGLERLRALRRARHLDRADRAGGDAADARDPAHRRRARRCASSSWAPRARSG